MNRLYINKDWSTLKKLIAINAAGGGAPMVEYTATGNPATFETNVIAPMELLIPFSPVQDLHGQDAPYPPGGSVQLMSPVAYTGVSYNMNTGVTLTLSEAQTQPTVNGNTITFSVDTAWVGLAFKTGALSAGKYHVHADVTDTSGRKLTFYVVGNDNIIKQKVASTNYNVEDRNFTVEADDYIVFFYTLGETGTAKVVNLQVESGEAYTAWHPYSNICPISGWTGANVSRTGKNLFDAEIGRYMWANGVRYVNDTGAYCASDKKFPIKGGADYAISIENTGNTNSIAFSWFSGDTFISLSSIYNATSGTVKSPENANMCALTFRNTDSYTGEPTVSNVSVSVGSTASPYEAYQGNTYPITFPSEAGTVYGGTLTVNEDGTGTLTVDRHMVDSSLWTYYASSNGYKAYKITSGIPLAKNAGYTTNSPISNMISEFGSFSSSAMDKNIIQPPTSSSTAAYMALDENVNPTDVQFGYLIATPVTYQLTELEVIETLKGVNNVWTDTNGVNTIKYMKKG